MSSRRNAVFCFVSPPIREALIADAFQKRRRALLIGRANQLPFFVNLHFDLAMVVAEVEFMAVALQVLRADAMECAVDAALEDGEVAFHGVCVSVPANVFTSAVVYNVVAFEHQRDQAILAFAVCHQVGVNRVHLCVQNGAQGNSIDGRKVHGAHHAAALDQREHHLLAHAADFLAVALAAVLVGFLAAYIRFVRLNGAARAEHAARSLHRFAEAMRHEPRGFVGHAEHALDLLAGNALLAARHERCCKDPFIKADLGTLEHRAYGYGELIAAMAAVIQAETMRFALELGNAVTRAAVRANRAIRPADGFKIFAGSSGVVESGFFEGVFSHDLLQGMAEV